MKALDFRGISIRWKALAVILLVVAASLLLIAAGLLLHARAAFERELKLRMTVLADVIGENSLAALSWRDPQAAVQTLAALHHDPRVLASAVYDADGRLLARYLRPGAEASLPAQRPKDPSAVARQGDRATLLRPIERDGRDAGAVFVVADAGGMAEALAQAITILVPSLAAMIAIGVFVSVGVRRLVTGPIEDLAELMRRIGRTRDPNLRATRRGNDEIGVLVDGFNGMLEEIAKRRAETERAKAELQDRVAALDAEVAERRRVEQELQRSRDQLQSFIDNASIGLKWLGPDGTILWANRYELQLLGYEAAEYVGRPAAGFHVDPHEVEDMYARLAQCDTLEGYEARLYGKDGRVRDVLVDCSVYREAGRFVHLRCFTRDITERKRVEARLRRSEERYRTLVAATTSVLFSTDAGGRVVERLPSWEEYTGQRWPRYAGAGWAAMVSRADRRRLKESWAQATAQARMFEAEVRVWHAASRRHRYCLVRAVPQRRPDGTAEEWLGTMLDIDDRKRAEEQFRSAIEGAPNAMLMVDQNGAIVLVNRELEALFGYERGELLGRPVETLVPARARHAHPEYRENFFRLPHTRPMGARRNFCGQHKNGHEIPIEIGLNPLRTENGVYCLASIVDVTERRRAEQELQRYTEELQRSNRELSQFAYVASHDLQEPLRAISGCVQLLQQRYHGKLDRRANDLIEHTVSGALRMQALINDLLSYSRVSTRARPFESCRLDEPLARALANLELAIREADAVITAEPMPMAHVDATQMTQLFQNLIGNAIKFRADEPPRVHVGAQARSGGYLLYVRDNGVGIEAQYCDRIFGVFQRLYNRNKYPGNGIGLAICRKIVERHNGRIWVESVPGKGSTFYFTLPSGNVHNEKQPELYRSEQR